MKPKPTPHRGTGWLFEDTVTVVVAYQWFERFLVEKGHERDFFWTWIAERSKNGRSGAEKRSGIGRGFGMNT